MLVVYIRVAMPILKYVLPFTEWLVYIYISKLSSVQRIGYQHLNSKLVQYEVYCLPSVLWFGYFVRTRRGGFEKFHLNSFEITKPVFFVLGLQKWLPVSVNSHIFYTLTFSGENAFKYVLCGLFVKSQNQYILTFIEDSPWNPAYAPPVYIDKTEYNTTICSCKRLVKNL